MKFRVTVDDPGMAQAHRLELEAPGVLHARLEGARRAIVLDAFGCGASGTVPAGQDPKTYALPLPVRVEHAADSRLVEAVAAYADAAAIEA